MYKDYADMEKEVVVAVALVVFVVGGEGVTADNNTTIQLLHCWIPTDNLGILFFVGGKMGERFEVLWGEGPCVCVCVCVFTGCVDTVVTNRFDDNKVFC